jgi:hypothetical protein
MATDAGHPGRANEDFVGAVPGAVVLLDGAGIPGAESVCAHGVAWFVRRLGGVLLSSLSRADGRALTDLLADAIIAVGDDHRDTCDLADPNSPQATVAMIRVDGDRLDYLLLADCFLVLDRVGKAPQILTDEREVATRRACSAPLDVLAPGSPEYDRAYAACVESFRARRNRAGGYWVAKEDPRAAAEALTGSHPIREIDGVALLSNGASRVVDHYSRTDWPGALRLLETEGAAGLIHRLRRAESESAADADDATVAYCTNLEPTRS